MGAIILSGNDQLCLDNGMGTHGAKPADPPFGGCEGCAVDLPLIRLLDKCRSRLELREIRAVAELCLGVAANDLVFLRRRDPLFNLLIRPLRVDDRDERYKIT